MEQAQQSLLVCRKIYNQIPSSVLILVTSLVPSIGWYLFDTLREEGVAWLAPAVIMPFVQQATIREPT